MRAWWPRPFSCQKWHIISNYEIKHDSLDFSLAVDKNTLQLAQNWLTAELWPKTYAKYGHHVVLRLIWAIT